ncbi:hypothetical protein [Rhodoferax bucti]|uniref:hypothetical protein n=1 Tax=Rhodoferax bucti TaxID=2576305 RepID=UPI001476DCB5|nr:hypothetical protein [Rhodoferax bucti]
MRTVRFLLLMLLSLAIPLAGYAGLGVPKMPCPMEMAAMAEQQLSGEMKEASATPMGECCNDMETLLKTGKTCKVGQDCKIGSLGLSVHLPSIPEVFSKDTFLARLNDRAIEPQPIPIWRPPA